MINGAKIGNIFEKCKDLREVLSLKAAKWPSGDSSFLESGKNAER